MRVFALLAVLCLVWGCSQPSDDHDQDRVWVASDTYWSAVTESGVEFGGLGDRVVNLPADCGCVTVSKLTAEGSIDVIMLPPLGTRTQWTSEPFGQVKVCPQ